MTTPLPKLKLLPYRQYKGVNADDPIKYYFWPVFGPMYRRRVEMALGECKGGQRVLEVGFGTGLAFLNLAEMYEEIYGIDLTAAIAQVQSVFAPHGIHPDLREGSVLEMPYADATFDTVLLISILEHLKPHELAQASARYGACSSRAGRWCMACQWKSRSWCSCSACWGTTSAASTSARKKKSPPRPGANFPRCAWSR